MVSPLALITSTGQSEETIAKEENKDLIVETPKMTEMVTMGQGLRRIQPDQFSVVGKNPRDERRPI